MRAGEPRRSVSGPYRDDDATLRARCEVLERENAALRERPQGLPPPPPRAHVIAACVGAAALGVLIGHLSEPPRVVVEHGSQTVRLDVDTYLVTHAWIDRVVDHVAVSPQMDDGAIVGLRIAADSPLLGPLGIRAEDVLMGVDHHWLGDPGGASEAWRVATTADAFTVIVRRRGVFRIITVEVFG